MASTGEDEDVWGYAIHEASWGGQLLDVISIEDQAPRAAVPHTYPHKNGADVEDMGGEPLISNWEIIFFERSPHPGESYVNHLERFARFEHLKKLGEAHTLVHPIRGNINAKIRGFSVRWTGDLRSVGIVSCEFIEDTTMPAVFDAAAGSPVLSGVDEVTASAKLLDEQLEELKAEQIDFAEASGNFASARAIAGTDFSTDVTADAIATVEAWEADEDITFRDVNLELVSLSNRIDAEIDRYECATNVDRYPILQSLTSLRGNLYKAAQIFSEKTPQVIEIHVKAPTPIDVIAARVYGAREASERAEELLQMNDIANPARVERDTILRGRSPYANQRRLRSPV